MTAVGRQTLSLPCTDRGGTGQEPFPVVLSYLAREKRRAWAKGASEPLFAVKLRFDDGPRALLSCMFDSHLDRVDMEGWTKAMLDGNMITDDVPRDNLDALMGYVFKLDTCDKDAYRMEYIFPKVNGRRRPDRAQLVKICAMTKAAALTLRRCLCSGDDAPHNSLAEVTREGCFLANNRAYNVSLHLWRGRVPPDALLKVRTEVPCPKCGKFCNETCKLTLSDGVVVPGGPGGAGGMGVVCDICGHAHTAAACPTVGRCGVCRFHADLGVEYMHSPGSTYCQVVQNSLTPEQRRKAAELKAARSVRVGPVDAILPSVPSENPAILQPNVDDVQTLQESLSNHQKSVRDKLNHRAAHSADLSCQLAALTELVVKLQATVTALTLRVEHLTVPGQSTPGSPSVRDNPIGSVSPEASLPSMLAVGPGGDDVPASGGSSPVGVGVDDQQH